MTFRLLCSSGVILCGLLIDNPLLLIAGAVMGIISVFRHALLR